jgi:hypothetical protein
MRALVLAHRYLGMAVGPLVLMWCLSGVVMMYVPYPRLTEAERVRALPPIAWDAGGVAPAGSLPAVAAPGKGDVTDLDDFRVEMLGGRPVLRTARSRFTAIVGGRTIPPPGESDVAGVAAAYAARSGLGATPRFMGVVDRDVWTISGIPPSERPLAHYALGDLAGTELYVSTRSGTLTQVTTARQRFWNALGAIPHWLYWVELRRRMRLWSATVVYTSLAGSFLAMTGLTVGILRLRRQRHEPAPRSPYRGWALGHHLAGLGFGLFALTWVASGLLSMNPWGLLEGASDRAERVRLRGTPVPSDEVMAGVVALSTCPAAVGAVSVAYGPLFGRPYFIVDRGDGSRVRLDGHGRLALLTEDDVRRAAWELTNRAPAASLDVLETGDAYFGHDVAARLPVIRVTTSDAERTRYYLDPVSATIVAKVDRNDRWYRWLLRGLHCLDVSPTLRRRPGWDVLMLALLAGVITVTVTGIVLGWRRVSRKPRAPRRSKPLTP